MSDKQLFSNNAKTTLNGGITAIATSITVTDGAVFSSPAAGEYELATMDDGTNVEIVKITSRAVHVLTVVRAQEGTTGFAFVDNVKISGNLTAGTISGALLGLDKTGNTLGDRAIDIKVSRDDPTETATGADSIAIGTDSMATGVDSTAIGRASIAAGVDSIAIGKNAYAKDIGNIIIGNSRGAPRTPQYATYIGNSAPPNISTVCKLSGPDYLPPMDDSFLGGGLGATGTDLEYKNLQVTEKMFTSVPVQIGAAAWAASTTYAHGATIIVSAGFSAFAHIIAGTYYDEGDSGGTEPTWTLVHGSTHIDGDITWYIVDMTKCGVAFPQRTEFNITHVGFICDESSPNVSTAPTVTFGESGNTTLHLGSTVMTGISDSHKFLIYEALNPANGFAAVQAFVTTYGDGTISGRFFWKGFLVETLNL